MISYDQVPSSRTWAKLFDQTVSRYARLKLDKADLESRMIRRGSGISTKDVDDKQAEADRALAEATMYGIGAILDKLNRMDTR